MPSASAKRHIPLIIRDEKNERLEKIKKQREKNKVRINFIIETIKLAGINSK